MVKKSKKSAPKKAKQHREAAPAKTPANAKQAQNLLDSIIQTGDSEAIDLVCDFLGVTSSLLLRFVEVKAEGGDAGGADDDDDDLENDENFEDEGDEDEDEGDDDDDSDEDEESDEDEDGDEDEGDEDEDFEDDESDEEDEESDEDDEGDDDDDDLDADEEEEDESDEDGDEDDDDDGEEAGDDEEDEESFENMPLSELRSYMKEVGIDPKAVLGKADPSDKDAVQAQLAKVANDMADHFDELSGKSVKTLEKIAKAEGVEVKLGNTRKPESIIEKYAETLAISRTIAANATKKASAKSAGGKTARKVGRKLRRG